MRIRSNFQLLIRIYNCLKKYKTYKDWDGKNGISDAYYDYRYKIFQQNQKQHKKPNVEFSTAQEKKTATTEEKATVPLYQGTYVGLDVFGLGSKIFGSDFTSAEVSVEVNLKNRFIPIIEIGYGHTDTTDDETNIHYKASAPYFRIGMNYNILFKKPHLPGYAYGGIRYGFTSFTYDVDAPVMVDPTWGNITVPFTYNGVKSNAGWVELVGGLTTKVYKNFYMGLSVRYRVRTSMKKTGNTEPWYIPGFGKNKANHFTIGTYSLIYKLPF